MKIVSSSFSFKSPKHDTNQDLILEPIALSDQCLFGIADGIGGNLGGEVAAKIAIQSVKECFLNDAESSLETMFFAAQNAVTNESSTDSLLKNMGTTLTICKTYLNSVEVGHVGDTRLYHLRGQGIEKRTKDQTELQKLIDEGILNQAQAKAYPRKNILLSSISAKNHYELFVNSFELQKNDRLVLMTDGAYSKISLRVIRDISLQSSNIENMKRDILSYIESNNPDDDYSCLIIENNG